MSLRRIILLAVLTALPLVTHAQEARRELDDQLWEAARKGDAAAVAALLDKGADVNAKFRYGTTALFKAAERGHTEVVKLLLARGADVTVKDTFYGATAMTWALENNHIEVVRALLEKSAGDVDEVLITGARGGNPALVRAALDRGGAKAETLTAALDSAMGDEKRAEIADMLRKAGAVP
ncbi:MAG TPA: ankyrin repeat domain-containing protein, partial [Pyrinomonadaceae bacterium]|nr:ankyrin repeat domain-containing protein [Pyrinomonadaceae bacterium]